MTNCHQSEFCLALQSFLIVWKIWYCLTLLLNERAWHSRIWIARTCWFSDWWNPRSNCTHARRGLHDFDLVYGTLILDFQKNRTELSHRSGTFHLIRWSNNFFCFARLVFCKLEVIKKFMQKYASAIQKITKLSYRACKYAIMNKFCLMYVSAAITSWSSCVTLRANYEKKVLIHRKCFNVKLQVVTYCTFR